MTTLTSMCEMVCQIIQKKQEEKRIEEEQAAKAQKWKLLVCYDDDDDYNFAITPNEPVNSLIIGDEHLNTILATELEEFIKSSVENIVLILSESEGKNECDVPACFTTFSNVLFDAEIDLSFTPDDPMLPGIEEDDYDSERDIPFLEELLDNYSLSLLKNESFHFDIPSSFRLL
nr:hypothetical protein [Tanacetum cinerariifolium]